MHAEPLGPALVSWNDFVGTADADESGRTSVYEVAGLDPAVWLILGVDLETTRDTTTLVVYALDQTEHGVESHADAVELGHQRGELPLTAFELPTSDRRLAADLFERLAVRLVARGFQDQRLTVRSRRTLPDPSEPGRPQGRTA